MSQSNNKDRSGSAGGLALFAASLGTNGSLLFVSVMWLAAQFSTVVVWQNFGDATLMATNEHRGWVFHLLTPPVTERSGLRFLQLDEASITQQSWTKHLADSNVRQPLPGIVVAHTQRFRLVAIRHWLVAGVTCLLWLSLRRMISNAG